MMYSRLATAAAFFSSLFMIFNPASGFASGITSQTFVLQPGWNSIFVELEPDDGDESTPIDDAPDTVFNLPEIEMVWAFPRSLNTVQYISQPNEINIGNPGWRVFLPPTSPTAALTNLFSVSAGRVYLVKLSGNQEQTLTVQGTPVYKRIQWQPESFNLIGFHADPIAANQVSFADYLSIPSDYNPPIYRLQNNKWQLISKSSLVEHGVGYWVYNDGSINQSGPFEVSSNAQNGLGFGQLSTIKEFNLINRSNTNLTSVQIEVGDFPLHYFSGFDTQGTGSALWPSANELNLAIDQDAEKSILLGVARHNLEDGQAGILTLRGSGMRLQVPLNAESIPTGNHGLWVGTAVINAVSNVNASDTTLTEPVRSPLTMKLLLHSSTNGVFLLKQVYLLGDFNIPDSNDGARTVLITEDEAIPNYIPLALSRGENAGYRLSSSAYDFSGSKLALTGSIDGTMQQDVIINPYLKTHPMLHQWHPDHDNRRNDDFSQIPAPEPDEDRSPFVEEVWQIKRQIKLVTTDNQTPAADTSLGKIYGEYQEIIQGMHKQDIVMKGVFSLNRISLITDLDPDHQ